LKFKYLIIAFGIITLIILSIIALLPLFLDNPFIKDNFRYFTLPLLIFMLLLLGSVCIFFSLNYRLLSLLEREDWPALAYYLEHKIYVKRQYINRYIRLLASSYLVISDYLSVIKLETRTMLAKPSLIDKNVLIFGAARILSANRAEASAFFKTHLDKYKGKDKQWLQWYYGFSLLLAGDFAAAQPEFLFLAASAKDAVVTGLSAYFLYNQIAKHSDKADECKTTAENGRDRVKTAIDTEIGWNKEVEKMASEIHIAIIRKYIEETGKWIYKQDKK